MGEASSSSAVRGTAGLLGRRNAHQERALSSMERAMDGAGGSPGPAAGLVEMVEACSRCRQRVASMGQAHVIHRGWNLRRFMGNRGRLGRADASCPAKTQAPRPGVRAPGQRRRSCGAPQIRGVSLLHAPPGGRREDGDDPKGSVTGGPRGPGAFLEQRNASDFRDTTLDARNLARAVTKTDGGQVHAIEHGEPQVVEGRLLGKHEVATRLEGAAAAPGQQDG